MATELLTNCKTRYKWVFYTTWIIQIFAEKLPVSSPNCSYVAEEVGGKVTFDCLGDVEGEEHSLHFDCSIDALSQCIWQRNGTKLFAGTSLLSSYSNNLFLNSDSYSLSVHPIGFDDEGKYSCKDSGKTIVEYCLTVLSYPSLSILINGTKVTHTFEGVGHIYYEISCIATGAKPPIPLHLAVNDISVTTHKTTFVNNTSQHTVDIISSTSYIGNGTTDLLSCYFGDGDNPESKQTIRMVTYVPPVLQIFANSQSVNETVTVTIGEQINVTCKARGAKPPVDLYWDLNNLTGRDEHIKKQIVFDKKSTVWLSVISHTKHIMKVYCKSFGAGSFQNVSRTVLILVKGHETIITLNGYPISSSAMVYSSKECELSCCTKSPHIITRSTLRIVYEMGNGSQAIHNVTLQPSEARTVIYTYPRNSLRSWITCQLQIQNEVIFQYATLNISVDPDIRIKQGLKNVSDITAYYGEAVTLQCTAYSARGQVDLFWKRQNATFMFDTTQRNTVIRQNKFHPGTFDTIDTMTIRVFQNESVACFYNDQNSKSAHVKITLRSTKKGLAKFWKQVVVLPLAVLLAFSVFLLLKYCRRGAGHADISSHSSKRSQTGTFSPEMDSTTFICPGETTVKAISYRMPSIDLPTTPNTEESLYEAPGGSECNEETYLKIASNVPSTRLFNRKDICLITKLSDGPICERWMGTISLSQCSKKCIYISRPKGTIYQTKHSWELHAKKCLELPKSFCIPEYEGLSVVDDTIYMLQKYNHTDDLRNHISQILEANGRNNSVLYRLIHLASQVAMGMEFLISHALSHPGLTATKIRVTEDEYCQLFEFCLKEDASRVNAEMIAQGMVQDCLCPPESTARNEYFWNSDMWYTALTIWEIFSGDDVSSVSIDNPDTSGQFLLLKPPLCPSQIFAVLLKAWSFHPALRPQFSELRLILKSHSDFVPEPDSGNTSISSDTYVPMAGNGCIDNTSEEP